MTKEFGNENSNVQQTDGLTGQVNNQADAKGEVVNKNGAGLIDFIVDEAVSQPTTEEQQREERRQDADHDERAF